MNTKIIFLSRPVGGRREITELKTVCDIHLQLLRDVVVVNKTIDDCDYCVKDWYSTLETLTLANEDWLANLRPSSVIYLAGPMTGLPDFNRPHFWMMEHIVKQIGCRGVLSPARHEHTDKPYSWYINEGLKMLCQADTVIMLKDWDKSNGACLEHLVANETGKVIFYEK